MLKPRLAAKAQKYREMAAGMTAPSDIALVLDYAERLERLGTREYSCDGASMNRQDGDRKRLHKVLVSAYPAPVVAPLMLEIMFSEVMQELGDDSQKGAL